MASSVLVVVVAAPGATDHDLVFLDRDLDRAVTRPVLGVDRVVLDGGVEPQAVALLAMVERALQRTGWCGATAGTPTTPPRGALGLFVVVVIIGLFSSSARSLFGGAGLVLGGFLRCLFGGASLLFGAALGFRLEFSSDLRVVFRAQIDLFEGGAILFRVGLETLFALEGLDLLDRHFQL